MIIIFFAAIAAAIIGPLVYIFGYKRDVAAAERNWGISGGRDQE